MLPPFVGGIWSGTTVAIGMENMKNKTITTLMAGVLLVAGSASAAQFTDADTVGAIAGGATSNPALTFDIGAGDGTGAFGFGAPEVLSQATVDFSFFRLPTAASKVEILIGGLAFAPTIVSTVGNFTHLGGLLSGAMLADLSDGVISYSIKNISTGSITVSAASLVAQSYTSVPDGSLTLGLFGLSLIGFACFGRNVRIGNAERKSLL